MSVDALTNAVLSQIPGLDSALVEQAREVVMKVPLWGWVALGAILFFLLGRLSVRRRALSAQKKALGSDETTDDEWQWRHEKLILCERHEAERVARREHLWSDYRESSQSLESKLKWGLAILAEEVREARQRVGSDFSRFGLVHTRLSGVSSEIENRKEAIDACMEIAQSQVDRLKIAREELREIGQKAIALSDSFQLGEALSKADREPLRAELQHLQELIGEGQTDWHSLSVEADHNIRDVLQAGGESILEPIHQILLVDGGDTASLRNGGHESHGGGNGLASKVRDLIDLIEEADQVDGSEQQAGSAGEDGDGDRVGLVPDEGFVGPVDIAETNGATVSRECPQPELPESGSLVLFRSNQVGHWGQNIYQGCNVRARTFDGLPDWAKWVSMSRMDTGETVYVSTEGFSLIGADAPGSVGFNGSNELFYGAHHLGMYSEACPNEVETRFTYGGWGFGHRVSDKDGGDRPLQATGWAGVEISPDTVLEISLHANLPDLREGDVLLEEEEKSQTLGVARSVAVG